MFQLQCHVCQVPSSYGVAFVLKPCNHVTCVKCFHQAVPSSHTLQCPRSDCHEWVTSSTLLEIVDSGVQKSNKENDRSNPMNHESVGTTTKLIQEVIHAEPDEQMDPFRHWAMKKPDLYSGFLYVAFRCNDEEASFYKANFQATQSTVLMDDNSCDDLVKIFARVLHPLLFRKDFWEASGSNRQRHPPTSSSNAKTSKAANHIPTPLCCEDRQQLALRSLYALSSGKVMSPKEQEEMTNGSLSSHKSMKRKAIDCAKDLAKELLLSKRHFHSACSTINGSTINHISGTDRQSRSQLTKRSVLLSPIFESEPRDHDDEIPVLEIPFDDKGLRSEEYEGQIPPYMLGFLLIGAAWMIAN